MSRRVVVTGMGCITPVANSVAHFREALFSGRSGIGDHVFKDLPGGRDAGLKFTRTAQVRDFVPEDRLSAAQVLATERSGQFAVAAAGEAVAGTKLPRERTAVIMGCSTGGRSAEEPETAKLYTRDARVHPLTVVRSMASAGASQVAMAHGITGPVLNISTACASGTHAIGLAFQMVRSGMVEAAICGGHEAPLTWGFLRAWDSMRVVSPTQCRPFAADRDGMTLGEGAAMLLLETLEAALARGATIYGEVVGFGMSCDATHITQPDPAGAERAMRAALADAQSSPAQVGYVNAHGTGTLANDATEAKALERVFGPRGVMVSGTKAVHGHSIGAAGAVEAVATLLMFERGWVPGSYGVAEAEEGLKVDLVVGEGKPIPTPLALSNSLAFGGLNAVLVLRSSRP